jgi:hypothetical protein
MTSIAHVPSGRSISPSLVIPANAEAYRRVRPDAPVYAAIVDPRVRQNENAKSETHDPKLAKVAQQFEALFVGQMLKSARAAALADDPFEGPAGATFRDFQDEQRAQALAKAAPLGVAKLLATRR